MPDRRGLARACRLLLVAVALLAAAGCGSDAHLARQEAVARANTCASLEERHGTAPVTIPPWQEFLAGAAERSDSQRGADARKEQNATQIKAECKAAVRKADRTP